MKRVLQYPIVRTVAVVIGIAAVIIVARSQGGTGTIAPTPLEPGLGLSASQEAYWEDRIQKDGAEAAYLAFGELLLDMKAMQQHNFAHEFGSLLYEIEGFEAMRACDDRFAWGCSHEIIARAIEENGLGIFTSLKELCDRDADELLVTGCYHGLGHGLVGWFGYTRENLIESLAACDTYIPDSITIPLAGCYSGVFMEHTLRTLTGLDAEGYRPASEGSFQELCFSLPEQYWVGCAFQAYQWWVTLSIDRSLERMAFIGEECRSFGRQDMVDACYMGVGDHLPVTKDRSPERIAALCSALSPEMGGRLLCQGFAAFITDFLSHEGGEKACTGLEGTDLEYCMKYADGKANWLHPEPLPTKYR